MCKSQSSTTKGGLLRDSYRWILDNDDFKRWRDDPQSQLLWIKGDPGKGKTMLLCGIIDELKKDSDNCLSYFFCQATEARLNNATAVLRGLIYLLVDQEPSLISHVRKKHDHVGRSLFEDANAWVALLDIFITILQDQALKSTFIIIDALDECVTGLPQLLDFIIQKSSLTSRVKWLISSRNQLDIEEKLNHAEQEVRVHLELNQDSIAKAVEIYIQCKVNQLALQKSYNDTTKHDVYSHLTSNADGTFLWVALVCQKLALPKARARNASATVKEFPPGLNPLYMRMMEYIHDLEGEDSDRCKQILATASLVYRPVDLEELRVLDKSVEDLSDNDLEEIISLCGSFLTLRQGIVYFVHQSAKDFLLKNASEQILPSGIAHQHHALFSRSLGALSETLRRDIYTLTAPGFSIDQISPPDPDPLASIRYSCVFWVDHLDNSEPRAKISDKDLQDAGIVYNLLQKKYLYWLESLSLLRSISEGVIAV